MADDLTTVYIVRHGETDWNTKGLIQGHTDIPLNEKGKGQARDLSEKLKDIRFDAVFSSDLLRAKETAEIIALERKLAVAATKLLRERNFGTFEGNRATKLDDYRELIAHLSDQEKYTHKAQGSIESDEAVVMRFTTYVREICIGYAGKTILVVTHGGTIRTFLLHLGVLSYTQPAFGTIGNTAYIKLRSDGVDFFVDELSGIILPGEHNGQTKRASKTV